MKKVLISVVALLVMNPKGYACDCDSSFIFHNSVEVLIGYVKRIELEEGATWKKITLDLKEIYKGGFDEIETEVEIFSLSNECGYYWSVGEFYLVFIEEIDNGRRFVNMCSMTRPIFYNYHPHGKWIGVPTLEEVKGWDFQNEVMKKWEVKY